METIQAVLDAELLKAINDAAARTKMNRSAFIRDAVRAHLKPLSEAELDDRDRAGYLKHPQHLEDSAIWEEVAMWPEGYIAAR